MRFLAMLLLCLAALFAALILIKDAHHSRTGDKRRASFRTIVVSVLFLLGLSIAAHARPSPDAVTQFSGDRYSGQAVAPKAAPHSRIHVARKARRYAPLPARRSAPSEAYRADAGLSLGDGIRREAGRAVGRPAAWCGWWLGHQLGMPLRSLWLARNWASVGTNAGGPQVGAVVVWRHHVGIITGRSEKGWIVKSGNDSHAVRERARSVTGAIAFRFVGGRGG